MFEIHCFGLRAFYFIYLLRNLFNVGVVLYLYYCYNRFRDEKVGYNTFTELVFHNCFSFKWLDLNAGEVL